MARATSFVVLALLYLNSGGLGQDIFGILPQGPIGPIGHKKLFISRVGQCVGKKNLPVYVPDMRIAAYNRTAYVVSGEVHFREDILNGYRLSVTVRKCDDIRATIGCRPFLNNIANTDGCALLSASGAMYHVYLRNFRPELQCPFHNGTYVMSETLVDDGLIKYLPGSGRTFWEVRMTGRIKERMMFCVVMQLNVRPKKKHV
ncbi:uncharacterized protein LOC131294023 [Anopheles ziemanni]|uniref:uncharacterized protein LOC131264759 n=1 Tax=Anopheles coustani TaxID=139045 RepID=UPI00265A0B04|nr:uncharacterized protein LOC131264759 [Anopheles coustani]XP_058178054.1 uncharacterized protein LOC131294023 [Anopheles ziemanni]